MVYCKCIEPHWPLEVLFTNYQFVSDFFIALAYFSIPLEIIYFVKKYPTFSYKGVLLLFGAFIVLCGVSHLVTLWTFSSHSRTVAIALAISKVLTGVVSCVTAVMLLHIIPDVLSLKSRERVLKTKAADLDREVGVVNTQEETNYFVRLLTSEIRSTLDKQAILNNTLRELCRTLDLEECALWMPTLSGLELQLSYTLCQQNLLVHRVPINLPVINEVLNTNRAVKISSDCPMARLHTRTGKYVPGDVAAIRVPLLGVSNFQIHDRPELSPMRHALMVLMLPSESARQWHFHELELVEVARNQVTVALSHAALLDECAKARATISEQTVSLDHAKREAETAIATRNDFLSDLNHGMRTPLHAIIALSSLLQETELTPEQRFMVEKVIKSSHLLVTLMENLLDVSRLDDGSFPLNQDTFNLHAAFRQVLNLIKPIASIKKLSITLDLVPDLPEFATGDKKVLMQTVLNVLSNAIKFSKDGTISITACVADLNSLRDSQPLEFFPEPGDNDFYLRVQIRDAGCGIEPQEIPQLFTKFAQAQSLTDRSRGIGIGLAICKRFINIMGGHIWVESEGLGKGCTVTFIVKLGTTQNTSDIKPEQTPENQVQRRQSFPGLKVLIVDDEEGRMVTKGLLTHLECDVATAGTLEPCLPDISHDRTIVFVDVSTPGGFGATTHLCKCFKDHDNRPLITALTGQTDMSTRERCTQMGMDGFVFKPLSLEKMRRVLSELIEHRMFFDPV